MANLEGINARFSDAWHKNDTLWRIREIPVDAMVGVILQLPPADQCPYEFGKADFMDPERGSYHMIFQKKEPRKGKWAWFIYQVQFHPR